MEKVDVAVVAKEMRGIIKESLGVMSCTIKRWPTTKYEQAHDVIYIDGGMSFKVHWEERLSQLAKLLDKLEVFGKAHGFSLICRQNYGRIWFIRDAV